MEEPNAKRIFDFSNGRRTNVTIDGRAAPVACEETDRCGSTGKTGAVEDGEESDTRLADTALQGLEGEMS
jgi:hypothetical protein